MKIQNRLLEVKEFIESKGYNVTFTALYGSQNYELDTYTDEYESDFDYKVVIVPTLRDLVDNCKPLSKVYDYQGGQVEVKDIRLFTDTLVKCNPAYLETIFTDHYIAQPQFCDIIRERRNLLVEMMPLFLRAARGMQQQKWIAFSRPYPSTKDKIDKYGYDPKQAHHITRLHYLARDTFAIGDMVLVPKEKDFLLDLKIGKFSIDKARSESEKSMDALDKLIEQTEDYVIIPDAKSKIIRISREIIYNTISKGVQKMKK